MTFQKIDDKIKWFYTSTNDDLVEDFYIPVLSEARRYDRLSGFFKSDSLALAARGISNLIKNEGHMRLLCGAQLSEEDVLAIKNADDLKDIVNKNFLGEYENLENQLVKNYVLLLGWMVANDFLEIKIGINVEDDNYYPDGMLHSKRGILYDEIGDCILFTGSVNETKYGWKKNIEDLRVDKSWYNEYQMKDPIKNFEELWNGNIDSLLVFDVPEASKKRLIKDAPSTKDEVEKIISEIESIRHKNKDKRILFPHQKSAISCWLKNNNLGILEMATGTGKTFTAINCFKEISKKEDILTVIACPYAHIITQWEDDLKDDAILHKFYGDANPNWRQDFDELKFHINLSLDFEKPNVILTTHNTFSKEDFVNILSKSNIKKLLIVDEMHHVGAKGFSKGLSPSYEYRLGLSATPTRFMDYEGTDMLLDYFGGIIFKFDISDALTKINNVTKKTFLTPYDYHPIRVDLTEEELQEYKKYSKLIAQKLNNKEKSNEKNLRGLFSKRRAVINDANQKYFAFRNILRKLPHKDRLIVFCSDKQLVKVLKILDEEGVSPSHKFTQKEGTKPEEVFNGLSQRQDLLKDFDKRICKALVAIKCLDEGVDVPSADQVIIMSSTTNPAEYIQRRGRVLRRFKNKDKAHIYDLCVIPGEDDKTYDKISENEKNRLIEFTKTASYKNRKLCMKLLEKWGLL